MKDLILHYLSKNIKHIKRKFCGSLLKRSLSPLILLHKNQNKSITSFSIKKNTSTKPLSLYVVKKAELNKPNTQFDKTIHKSNQESLTKTMTENVNIHNL